MSTTGTPSPATGLSHERCTGHTLIAVRGELDVATTPHLRERLNAALVDAVPPVVIDLSGVTFCDASGLTLLVEARRRAHGAVVLAAPRPQMAKLLRVTGLDRAFTVSPNVTAARLARPGARPAA
ncbi:STAS domain-containing protein [Actinomadura roseirufa]|uniref:STAS domain-containing protein n=1 Tax=Actinomadura roseirufa TaxID=2094049 RepID=UPI001041232E|nr:STAS domain-containing protein [Actinomadura roseirufa]